MNEVERMRGILENLDVGVIVHAPDTSIIFNNTRASEILGLTRDQLIGKQVISTDCKFFRADNTPLPQEDFPVNKIIRQKKEIKNMEIGVQRPDTNETRWAMVNGLPIFTDNNVMREIIISFTDITERKNAEEELAMLAAIVTNSEDAIISRDFNGIIKTWNKGAEHLLGYNAQEAIGQSLLLIIPPELYAEEKIIIERILRGERIAELKTVRLKKDQRLIDVIISLSPIVDNQGNISGVAKIIRDNTETKRVEDQLSLANYELSKAKTTAEASNAAKSSFLSSMSHEIRTPMNAIIGMADLLSQTNLDDTQKKYVEIFQKAGFNLLHIIDDILDISKIESGMFNIHKVKFNFNGLVAEVIEILKIKAEEKKLLLTYDYRSNTSKCLMGDDYRIKQVLTNLVGNAIKFTNSGFISVKISPNIYPEKKGNICVEVIDTGIGIPKDQQNKLFQNYSQADNSTTKNYGGSGLGLAISKKLVELMGGEIWLQSREGQGTKVIFTLSCEEANVECPDKDMLCLTHQKTSDHHYQGKILLVDDAEFNRILIQEYLKDTNYEIIEAENGKDALDKAKVGEFDIILMDMQMPVMDGYQATQEIRDWEKKTHHAHIPIVAVTAYAIKEEEEKSIDVGCDKHLSKPILKDTLMNVLESVTRD